MSTQYDYDVVIIGSGMGGLTCGTILAAEGMRVCVVEKGTVLAVSYTHLTLPTICSV